MLLVSVDGPRPTHEQVLDLRGHMLHYVHQLILKGQGIHEDELQSVLNYLTTVHEVSGTQPDTGGTCQVSHGDGKTWKMKSWKSHEKVMKHEKLAKSHGIL